MAYTIDQIIIPSLINNSLYVTLYPGTYYLFIKGSGKAEKTLYGNNGTGKAWKATTTKGKGWSGTFKITKETTGHFYSGDVNDISYFDILVKPTVSTDFSQLENVLSQITNEKLKQIAEDQGEYSTVESPSLKYISEQLSMTQEQTQSLLSDYTYAQGKYTRLILAGRDMYNYFTNNRQPINISKDWANNLLYTNYTGTNTTSDLPSDIPDDTGFIYLKYKG